MSFEIDPVFGCHLWKGKLDRDGYPFHGRSRAHIVAWVAVHGVVPVGFELDHECRRRHCVNEAHLEPVTRAENERRKSWRQRIKRSICRNGHDLNLHAMVTPEGGRLCRMCKDNPRQELR